jgi:hypothetical protein
MTTQRFPWVWAAAGLLAFSGLGILGAGEPPDPAKLVEQLGAPEFAKREAASRELAELGAAALPALREAVKSGAPEVRRRAEELVKAIETQLESAGAVQPTRVKAVYRNRTVAEIADDLRRQTGMAVAVDPSIASCRVTLNIADTTFWEAIDAVCDQAQLRIAGPKLAEPLPLQRNRVRVIRPADFEQLTTGLLLADGPKPAGQVLHAGALRIQALCVPAPKNESNEKNETSNEIVLKLEVLAEPRLHWQGQLNFRAEELIDDRQQLVVFVNARAQKKDEDNDLDPLRIMQQAGQGGIVIRGNFNGIPFGPGTAPSLRQELDVTLRLPDQPGQKLALVKATLAGQVQMPWQPLLTVPDVTKAGKEPIKGKDGAQLRIVDLTRRDDGRVALKLELDTPSGGDPVLNGIFNGIAQIQRMQMQAFQIANGQLRGLNNGPLGLESQDLVLTDQVGRPFGVTARNEEFRVVGGASPTRVISLVLTPPDAQAEPRKLVYLAPTTANLEVPITLKDVPLPK